MNKTNETELSMETKHEIIGTIEVEVVKKIRHDLLKGEGTIGASVDLLLCEVTNSEEILRKVTVHIDEERM
jgi:hypothetical protein